MVCIFERENECAIDITTGNRLYTNKDEYTSTLSELRIYGFSIKEVTGSVAQQRWVNPGAGREA